MLWKTTHFWLSEGWKFSLLPCMLYSKCFSQTTCMQKATYVLDGGVLYPTTTSLGPISLVLVDSEPNSYWCHCLRPCMCSRSVASKQNHCMWWSKPNPILCESLDGWLDTKHMETRRQGAQMTSMLRVKTWFLDPIHQWKDLDTVCPP